MSNTAIAVLQHLQRLFSIWDPEPEVTETPGVTFRDGTKVRCFQARGLTPMEVLGHADIPKPGSEFEGRILDRVDVDKDGNVAAFYPPMVTLQPLPPTSPAGTSPPHRPS